MPDLPEGSVLAFDFGTVRIGVAQGCTQIGIAHPLTTITGNSNEQKFAQIAQLIHEWQPNYLVVGLPTHADGTAHETTQLAKTFGHRLHGRFGLPIYWADERFSSVYAEELLKENHITAKKRKTVLDQVAAQALLQWFFDGGRMGCFDGHRKSSSDDKL